MPPPAVKSWFEIVAYVLLAAAAIFVVFVTPLIGDLRHDLRARRQSAASLRRAFELACDLFETTRWVQIIVSRTGDGYVAAALLRGSPLAVTGQVPMSTPDGALESLCIALTKQVARVEQRKEVGSGWSA
jgi:hypothetical protein